MFHKIIVVLWSCVIVNGQGNFGNESTVGYDAGELLSKIFFGNDTQLRRLIKFENEFDSSYVSFNDQNIKSPSTTPFIFEIDQGANKPNDGQATNVKLDHFGQDVAEDGLNNLLGNGFQHGNGKKKRRRRKQRKQLPGQSGFWNPGYPGANGQVPEPGQSFSPFPGPEQSFRPPPGSSHNFGQFYRPPLRPQSSLASDALAAVTGALTSIARNDDYQCVARLLCEAAAGGALGGSSLLESVSGLQPLLTLLSAYNGISSNPLFIFGRAAFLGMSSKGNPGSCRYAYPLCPTDPEQLVHYLNNHNGGFFRFFSTPQYGQQNLEQFYDQLSQNYGLYQPNLENNQELYGLLSPGLYQNPASQPNLYPNSYGYQQNYGLAYPYNQNYDNGNGIRFKNYKGFNDDGSKVRITTDENKIEKRIQNKPAIFLNDNSVLSNSKWLFPGEDDDDRAESEIGVKYVNDDDFGIIVNKKGKVLKFPDADSNYNNQNIQEYNKNPINFYTTEKIRTPKWISFPERQNNIHDYNMKKYYSPEDGMKYFYSNANKGIDGIFKGVNYNNNNYNDHQDEAGVKTVYVVRGNGDPSKPEIIKLRPGETI